MKWIPQSLRSYDGQPVTAADQSRPEVHISLMRRQRNTLKAAMVAVPPTAFVFAVLLWPHADHLRLCIWLAITLAGTLFHIVLHLRLPLEAVSNLRLAIAHGFAGAAWASLTVIAMPDAPEWQAMVGTMVFAVLAAGLIFTSQFAVPFAAWVCSCTGVASIGYLLVESRLGNALALITVLSAGFSLLLGAVLRAGDLGASVFAARNADLVQELREEKQQLRVLATTDPLTGVYNRLAFTQDLDAALASPSHAVAMALIDLDDFKRINDSLGHHAGDQVLQFATDRISRSLRPGEKLYRLGGDELTVIQSGNRTTHSLTELGERLKQVFQQKFVVGGHELEIRASIGIAAAVGSADAEALQRGADEALYRAKRTETAEVQYFDAAMRTESAQRSKLRKSVSKALEAGQIVPWFQPVVELSTGAVIGAESLARWEHPDGVRSAATFVAAIEESGMGTTLDNVIFTTITQHRSRLDDAHGDRFLVSCNISPVYLKPFLDRFEPTGHLDGAVIEITEQRDLSNHTQLSRLVKRAQDAGAEVVVDDFGTGFSSMERLSLGSFDGLKIDGSFVQSLADRPNSRAIVASIAVIGQHLDVPVVAEGIESAHHSAQLAEYGVKWGQGYLYSPAVPIEELIAMLESQHVNGPYFSRLAVQAAPLAELEARR